MSKHLKEFDQLVGMKDTYRAGRGIPEPPSEVDITRCIQIMLARQCIYPTMHGISAYYNILKTVEYQDFFQKYFAAMGYELVHDTRNGMIALKVEPGPRYDHQASRLKKDETAVLLALRILYEEGFRERKFTASGAIETTTNDVYDRLNVIGGIQLEQTRFIKILEFLKKKGLVVFGDRDPVESVYPLDILPGIELAVPYSYIERVSEAAASAAQLQTLAGSNDGSAELASGIGSGSASAEVEVDEAYQDGAA